MLFTNTYPVTCHSDHVGIGSTFVAIKGFKDDGVQYISTAIEKGTTKIVLQEGTALSEKYAGIDITFVPDTRKALAELSAQALGNPSEKLRFVGITGTCGKTTTTYLIESILKNYGYKTALLGSVKNKILDQEEDLALTTQNSDYIQMFLAECMKKEVQVVVMEVSSHGLALDRVHGIKFDVAGFTNLSREHMDFHPTMDHYFQTKMRLFENLKPGGLAVINADNEWSLKAVDLLSQQESHLVSFGQARGDARFELIQNSLDGLKIRFHDGDILLESDKLLGEFNGYNISMACLACKHFGIPLNVIAQAIKKYAGVPGRMQCHFLKNGAKAFVDFAHKPEAMENVLKTLRTQSDSLIVVFGCGGNRDKTKRPVMGALAGQYADQIIVTDDNPRNEDRQTIANEIIAGIPQEKQGNTTCLLDRKVAITKAVEFSKPGSIIAILGKGHENYYLINGKKTHLDDFEEISKF
jgi:UDP-N-acetylmuramoyl-L-alanyl-D-glutamate--2,6-diaminopimelate ligase